MLASWHDAWFINLNRVFSPWATGSWWNMMGRYTPTYCWWWREILILIWQVQKIFKRPFWGFFSWTKRKKFLTWLLLTFFCWWFFRYDEFSLSRMKLSHHHWPPSSSFWKSCARRFCSDEIQQANNIAETDKMHADLCPFENVWEYHCHSLIYERLTYRC